MLPAVEKAEIEPTPRGYGKPPAGYGSAGNTTAPAAPGGKNQGFLSLVQICKLLSVSIYFKKLPLWKRVWYDCKNHKSKLFFNLSNWFI